MLIAAAIAAGVAIILLPTPAMAWGPVTHVAFGMQALATLVSGARPIYATLEAFPEVFLYGSLAPDIVQGRRLQSRLRRHSHNWAVALGLVEGARSDEERAFAYGYLAHLGADVVAHNYFLPARLIGGFDSRLSGHIYYEARFDSIHEAAYRELLLDLLEIDFRSVDTTLARAVDSPLISFKSHRRIFEGGLKRIRHLHRAIAMLGGPAEAADPTAGLEAQRHAQPANHAGIGVSTPSTTRMVVVLPAPLRPTNPNSSPAWISKVRSCTATVCPYRFEIPSISSCR